MADEISRREALRLGLAGVAAGPLMAAANEPAAPAPASPPLLTPASKFRDVSRSRPHPTKLSTDDLAKARLTPETWRLEVVSDGTTQIANPLTGDRALSLPALRDLAKTQSVKFFKAMQCLNISEPLGQGLWEGVPLRAVLRLLGKMNNIRRLYYWGFHNNDAKQMFRSSLTYTQAMETPPWELPAFLAFRLNGEPLTLERGGPVRMLVPWAHGFKSIKWLQHIVLTNDFKANDTYAEQNNDPESHLKTAAYLTDVPAKVATGATVVIRGTAIVGLSGLRHVEVWIRPSSSDGDLADDDPAWQSATWTRAVIDPAPSDWAAALPRGVNARDIWGFDGNGQPKDWPLRYSMAGWSASVMGLAPGRYEVRARTVDLNGFAQPEPRPYPKSGRNMIQVRRFTVGA
jgi:DMSO/TMAO reductase YedYZ molybdopterin-dependent catalytic subunit